MDSKFHSLKYSDFVPDPESVAKARTLKRALSGAFLETVNDQKYEVDAVLSACTVFYGQILLSVVQQSSLTKDERVRFMKMILDNLNDTMDDFSMEEVDA